MVSPVHGDYRRCQAETPLSDLFKFAEPALSQKLKHRDLFGGRPVAAPEGSISNVRKTPRQNFRAADLLAAAHSTSHDGFFVRTTVASEIAMSQLKERPPGTDRETVMARLARKLDAAET
jgi:hypothetical protein